MSPAWNISADMTKTPGRSVLGFCCYDYSSKYSSAGSSSSLQVLRLEVIVHVMVMVVASIQDRSPCCRIPCPRHSFSGVSPRSDPPSISLVSLGCLMFSRRISWFTSTLDTRMTVPVPKIFCQKSRLRWISVMRYRSVWSETVLNRPLST